LGSKGEKGGVSNLAIAVQQKRRRLLIVLSVGAYTEFKGTLASEVEKNPTNHKNKVS